jgi:hypothetical protein
LAKEKKRALEGKDTACIDQRTGMEVSPQKIENLKRRKTQHLPHSIGKNSNAQELLITLMPGKATPPTITFTCHTPPSVDNEGHTPGLTGPPCFSSSDSICSDGSSSYPSYSAQASSTSMFQDSSVEWLGPDVSSPLTTTLKLPEVPAVSMMDRYLSERHDPWFTVNRVHQRDVHEKVFAKHKHIFELLREFVVLPEDQDFRFADLPAEQTFPIDLRGIGDQFSAARSCPNCEPEEAHSEIADLENLFGLAVKLAECQSTHGELAVPTSKQEFKLAIAAGRNGFHEAEYHCRKALSDGPNIMVQTFLGMILAKDSRLEESNLLLFSALACFIVDFTINDLDDNATMSHEIEVLFAELIWRNPRHDQDWSSLTACMRQMLLTIQKAISKGTTRQIFPQLLTCGFSFAQECKVLEFDDSARYMYQILLDSCSHVDVVLHNIDVAAAHQAYGFLLRKEERWKASAEQLLLASKSALSAETKDIRLIAQLNSDYKRLYPYLVPEGGATAAEIKQLLARASTAVQLTRLEEYWLSDLPLNLATLESGPVSCFAQSSLANNSVHTDGNRTSTMSMSDSSSGNLGVTYPHSLSDSALMVP